MRFLPTFIGAFHSPQTYESVRQQPHGLGLFYAFVLVMLSTAISAIYLTFTMHQALLKPRDGQPAFLDEMFAQISEQLPPMVLATDGTLEVDAEQPLTIRLRGDIAGEAFDVDFITIDTTGATDHTNMPTPILITRTDLISQDSKDKVELHPLKKLMASATQPLTTDDVQALLAEAGDFLRTHAWKFYAIVLPFAWGIITGIFYVLRIMMLMALGVVGVIVGNIGAPSMSYTTAVRMASVAYTPVEVFNTLAFLLVMDGASTVTLFALGALLLTGAILLTNPPKQPAPGA